MEITKGKKISWIDIANPTVSDLTWLQKKLRLHPVIVEELREPSDHPLAEVNARCLYLIFQFPSYDAVEKISRRREIDIVVTKNHVITVHYTKLTVMDEFRNALKDRGFKDRTFESTLHVTYEIIRSLLEFNQRQLRHVEEKVERIAEHLFKDKEKEILKEISFIKRDLSEYRIIIRSQEHFLKSFLENGIKFWGEMSRVYLNDLVSDYLKVVQQLQDYREVVSDFEDTNNQIMNIRTTEIMKTFTTLSFMTFPFVLLAAVLSINTIDNPLLKQPNGFALLVGIVVIGIVGLFLYFRRKGWL